MAVLEEEPLVREAITDAFAELDVERPKRDAELTRIAAEITKTSQTLDRYFEAFETGTMPAQACGQRIDELSASSPDSKPAAKN